MDRERPDATEPGRRALSPAMIALLFGVGILILVVAFIAVNRGPNQDKLSDPEVNQVQPQAANGDTRCSSQRTFDFIKGELFRRAAQLRGSDQAAYAELAGAASVRMENAVMESKDEESGAANCSGSLALDLPPGVAVTGGRRVLTANVDYTVQAGGNVTLRNTDAIVGPLATLTRVVEAPPASPADENEAEPPEENVAASVSANVQPGPATSAPGRPSFDCARAESRGEVAVCSDSGLAALDLNMATQYRRALASASPAQKDLLQSTRDRFLAYRDRCPNRQCMADAYVGRMREIRDISEGRWRAPR
jgi:uncharacterized protein YecT (DUF1311 family)